MPCNGALIYQNINRITLECELSVTIGDRFYVTIIFFGQCPRGEK